MLRGFSTILVKELKELIRDPKILIGMIVVPLIMFPVLGGVLGYAAQSAQSQAANAHLLIVDEDGGNWSGTFVEFLSSSAKVTVVQNVTAEQVVSEGLLAKYNSSSFIEVPAGFSANVTAYVAGSRNSSATVNIYGVYTGGGIFSDLGSTTITAYVQAFNRYIAPNAVFPTQSTIIKGQVEHGVDPASLAGLMISQTIALPITIMILLTYAMQIAATSVAMEKEEKTLETLLTMPVDRFSILMGKLASTIIVAGVAAVTVLIGYNYMLSSISFGIQAGTSIDLVKLGLVPTPLGYFLLGVSLFVTLLSALALAVIMSAFSEDVRGAQALIGYIYPIIFIPALALLYLDINTLPVFLKAVFYAIPYSHPIIAAKAVVLGDYGIVLFGIVYVTAFTVVIMYVASRLFATEKILTAKFKFGRASKKLPREM